jgi:hypothetical protein
MSSIDFETTSDASVFSSVYTSVEVSTWMVVVSIVAASVVTFVATVVLISQAYAVCAILLITGRLTENFQ